MTRTSSSRSGVSRIRRHRPGTEAPDPQGIDQLMAGLDRVGQHDRRGHLGQRPQGGALAHAVHHVMVVATSSSCTSGSHCSSKPAASEL